MAAKSNNTESILDRIIGFIDNCDQKANILLAFIGVIMTILLTSNMSSKVQNLLIIPFVNYWKNDIGTFHCGRFLLFISITCVCFFAGCALYYLIKVVRPQIDNKGSKSRIYFGHISTMTFEEFKNRPQDYDYEDDLLQQVHINSQICTRKFTNLRKAINYIIGMIVSCFIMYILILFL